MKKKILFVHNLRELRDFAEELVAHLSKKQVLVLTGAMGAGKTTFVQALIGALGGEGVNSPTFSLHRRYTTPKGDVDHWDLYRLKGDLDLESSGFWDGFSEDQGLVLVEWGDRLTDWPAGWRRTEILFEVQEGTTRKITVRPV